MVDNMVEKSKVIERTEKSAIISGMFQNKKPFNPVLHRTVEI